ncbi:hypothetical protein SUGI_0179140 [Cryptomeria japonica]|uniref:signal peptidase complex subunit 1 n=1 Tax=Cryptomeria japonica TaxID=3369 RepID=UPI002408D320|nr:signal peptidase complex subunit 1 [Cryptomeria japonica]GLJ11879.1 hypothetical protein SUGI_0179140 [Cryptomeria japonica]
MKTGKMAEGRLQASLEQSLQYSLIISALAAVLWGYYTWSFKKMVVTYAMGVLCTLVVIIPDWTFFARHPSEWGFPMPSDKQSAIAQKARFHALNHSLKYAQRFNFYPIRFIGFTLSYGYIIYSTWKYMTT